MRARRHLSSAASRPNLSSQSDCRSAYRRVGVLNLLADLKSRGLSIPFITHDLSLGYYISEQAVILYRGRVAEMGLTERNYQHPQHPYTRMLMSSVSRLDKKWEEVELELKAKQSRFTSGCVYHERCPEAAAECQREAPPLVEVEANHSVACIRYGTA